MSKVYFCPHCQTQNFATPARLRQAKAIPLRCWKCGKEIKTPFAEPRRNQKMGREKGEE